MDLQSLVAAHIPDRSPSAQMDAAAEDRYYRGVIAPPTGLLRAWIVATTTAGMILLLVGLAQA